LFENYRTNNNVHSAICEEESPHNEGRIVSISVSFMSSFIVAIHHKKGTITVTQRRRCGWGSFDSYLFVVMAHLPNKGSSGSEQ